MSRITTAESALQTANSLFVDDNFEDALKHYSEAIELDENNADTFVKRSTCYYKLENFEGTRIIVCILHRSLEETQFPKNTPLYFVLVEYMKSIDILKVQERFFKQ
jgi:hypothetical protein